MTAQRVVALSLAILATAAPVRPRVFISTSVDDKIISDIVIESVPSAVPVNYKQLTIIDNVTDRSVVSNVNGVIKRVASHGRAPDASDPRRAVDSDPRMSHAVTDTLSFNRGYDPLLDNAGSVPRVRLDRPVRDRESAVYSEFVHHPRDTVKTNVRRPDYMSGRLTAEREGSRETLRDYSHHPQEDTRTNIRIRSELITGRPVREREINKEALSVNNAHVQQRHHNTRTNTRPSLISDTPTRERDNHRHNLNVNNEHTQQSHSNRDYYTGIRLIPDRATKERGDTREYSEIPRHKSNASNEIPKSNTNVDIYEQVVFPSDRIETTTQKNKEPIPIAGIENPNIPDRKEEKAKVEPIPTSVLNADQCPTGYVKIQVQDNEKKCVMEDKTDR